MQLSAKCENEHFYRYESFKGDSVQTTKGKKSRKAVKKKKKKICPFHLQYLCPCTWFWGAMSGNTRLEKCSVGTAIKHRRDLMCLIQMLVEYDHNVRVV